MRFLIPALLLSLLTSCSATRVYVGVAQARNDYSRGDYQQANRRLISLSGNDAFAPWISYDLGSVYYALGEAASAMEIWSATDGSASDELGFLLEFNQGVLDYERGAYGDAYQRFVRALEIDPSSVEAKVNLEFAAEKMDSTSGTGARAREERDAAPGAEVGRLLQYLERLEQNSWQSTEKLDVPERGNDW